MKAILCGVCADIRALRDTGPVTCECGNVTGWWVDPQRGTAKVFARDREKAKIIGVMNGLIFAAFKAYDYSPDRWREIHDELTSQADGYAFHKDQRGCPVAIIGVGMSSDVSWADEGWRRTTEAAVSPPACENCGATGVQLIREGDGPTFCRRCSSGIAPCGEPCGGGP